MEEEKNGEGMYLANQFVEENEKEENVFFVLEKEKEENIWRRKYS